MANVTYTVQKGDTLSGIAVKYDTTVNKLVELNNIKDPDYIVVGQVLIVSGTPVSQVQDKSYEADVYAFGLQSNSDRTVYAAWNWDREKTDYFMVMWKYATGDGVGFVGSEANEEHEQSLYTAPENATHVSFKVKPTAKKREVNGGESSYWWVDWSREYRYYFKDNPPTTPSVPSVEIDGYKLTAKLDNLDVNATEIQFQVVKDDSKVFSSGKATIKTTSVSYSCTVDADGEYKVRCRSIRDKLYSEWTEYSNTAGTAPSAPDSILELRALSKTSIYMDWSKVKTADNYEIEYAEQKSRFDSSTDTKKITIEAVVSHVEISGLESGKEYFFRVRATNEKGNSGWTDIKSVKIGKAPAAPTTWSSTTTVMVGEPLILYWVHNSEDGSSQTYAQLETYIGGTLTTHNIKNSTDEDEKDKTSFYEIDTSGYSEGTKVQWRVRTIGIMAEYGEWSVQRTVDVYAPPSLALSVTNANGNLLETLERFPFYISGTAGPNTQYPIGYHVSIVADETYEALDDTGNSRIIKAGEEVYSKHFDISAPLLLEISAGNVNLQNGISYTVVCTVSMNSGLTAESSLSFDVVWSSVEYLPDAEIGYDKDTFTTFIRPYCSDVNGRIVEDVLMSVYRREFDGSLTELMTGIDGASDTFITDPHPALDYARYRIVSISKTDGYICYYDVPGYPIGEKAAIIQWDESWSNFDTGYEDVYEEPVWSGSLLRLPYNIDVSDKYNIDVEHVEYVGREHPVTYYGTQLGQTSTWNMDIPKSDKDTLYALRRLAIWTGDVYVREPSGSGYWASVKVSFSQKHCVLTIPITLEITRVAGGV